MVLQATSAAGIIALLDEPDYALKEHALQRLNALVPIFWPEIADALPKIEAITEEHLLESSALATATTTTTTTGKGQSLVQLGQLASLVASKVFYQLDELDESLNFALGAGPLFDALVRGKVAHDGVQSSEYVEHVITRAIERYVREREQASQPAPEAESATEGRATSVVLGKRTAKGVDERLVAVVEGMFERTIAKKEYRNALGIALEAKRIDIVEKLLVQHRAGQPQLMQYVLNAAMTVVQDLAFRTRVLEILKSILQVGDRPDWYSLTKVTIYLGDAPAMASIFKGLLDSASGGDHDAKLMCLQLAYDIVYTASQQFILNVRVALTGTSEADVISQEVPEPVYSDDERKYLESQLSFILSGKDSIRLHLDFLARSNKTDLAILTKTMKSLEARNSVYHSAVTFANAFMHAGTSVDSWLRNNLDWLSKATNWTKFSATAGLGVIHMGNIGQGQNLLGPYLPQASGEAPTGAAASPYSQGGALYALGLIHANHSAGPLPFMRRVLEVTTDEVVQHGAALGIGIAVMTTGNTTVYDELKNVLFSDSAVAGEACGYAIGLLMAGRGELNVIQELAQYAHETQHEKIIRGLGVGMALIMLGRESDADSTIKQLLDDTDPILRYGGIHMIGLAYAGSSSNKAIRQLLHVAVSDVNDDVRRAAVTNLGFVLVRDPDQVPRIVQLLAESYNPYVRYGAAMALGIACAGSANEEAIALLLPMTKDPTDFVRQGAFIALGLILVEHNDQSSAHNAPTRKLYETVIADKHEDPVAKFGAVLGQSIIDAGGRNVTLKFATQDGILIPQAIIGMVLFTQFWYWFPLTHCLALGFQPTSLVVVDGNLNLPKLELKCDARPSLFAYPPPVKAPTSDKPEKVATAVLSTTAKAKARQKQKEEKEKEDVMETDENETKEGSEMKVDGETTSSSAPAAESAPEAEVKDRKKKKEIEPSAFMVGNLSRLVPSQSTLLDWSSQSRYRPIRTLNNALHSGGIVVVKDTEKGAPEEFVARTIPGGHGSTSAAAAATSSAGGVTAAASSGAQGDAMDSSEHETDPVEEAEPPEEFDYPFGPDAEHGPDI